MNIINCLNTNTNKRKPCFNGILHIDNELSDIEFSKIINKLNNKIDNTRIAIIDSSVEAVIKIKNTLLVPNLYSEFKIINKSEDDSINITTGNLLRCLRYPTDYIVFRELISKDNIEDILTLLYSGRNVIAFTNMDIEELIELAMNTLGKTREFIGSLIYNLYK